MILMCWSAAQSDAKIKRLIAGFQLKYREMLTGIVRRWQERGELPAGGDAEEVGKALFSFVLEFIVQSALLSGIDPEIASRGIAGMLGSGTGSRGR